jgi:DNA-binding GntR family transcriptional regulator
VGAFDTGWIRANDLFHEVVQEAAANDRLRRTIADLHHSFPRNLTWSALAENSRLLSANADEHRRVLAAVQQHNPAEARQAMKDHILRAGELVAAWFERPLASS